MRQTVPLIALAFAILSALIQVGEAAEEVDTDAAAREALFNKAEAAQVSERLRAEPRMLRSFQGCPADAFERERPFWRGLAEPRQPTERTCALHPAECYDLCVGWANGPACFNLAQAYEHHSLDTPDELDRQRFHALACAMGYPAGCTNRAAGIRNGGYRDDPFRSVPLATKQACEYRSFLIDCDRHGARGCAMLGQAYRNGEGVASQPQRARAAFRASCEISPKFAACDFAKGQLERMDRPPPPKSDDPSSDED
jgi:TPR repeat protein